MMSFEDAEILYLDDVKDHLDEAQEKFSDEGYKMEITESIEDAKNKALTNEVSIFICDLRLDQITTEEKGSSILRFIRSQNKEIFLALYTSYEDDLTSDERNILKKNAIEIYDKSSTDEFLLNLRSDYTKFQESKKENSVEEKIDFEHDIKIHVLNHLKNVSNPNLIIPIPEKKDISVQNLIEEVNRNTETGRLYMKEWLNTMLLIKHLRKEK